MPSLANRPCAKLGCNQLTSTTYCTAHTNYSRQQSRDYDRSRSSDEIRRFNTSAFWKATSKRFLSEHRLCEDCGRLADAVHHRVRARVWIAQQNCESEQDRQRAYCDEANLMALCKPCHNRRTAKAE